MRRTPCVGLVMVFIALRYLANVENGQALWLKYKPVTNTRLLLECKDGIKAMVVSGEEVKSK